jgi:catechol 2,3-dioxygenase-like lactoylglutathione lyase family enzyme
MRLRGIVGVIVLAAVIAPMQAQRAIPARPAITGISHVGLDEDDAAAATKLYTGLVGWPSAPGVEHTDGLRFLVNSKQYIEIFPTHGNLQQPELDHIAFETADAAALMRYLRSKGVSVPERLTLDRDGRKRFMVVDPEGNRVEFVQSPGHGKPVASSPAELGNQLIHLGFVVTDQQAENRFYEDILGFRHFWTGWVTEGKDAWVDMQVPEGSDWIEYMLVGLPRDAPREKLASPDHFSFGVVSRDDTIQLLNERGYSVERHGDGPMRDGKRKMDLRDPGGTRVEIMEYQPVKEACCGGYHGPQPSASDVSEAASPETQTGRAIHPAPR